jgi:two-component system cell cycle sensor histidine kinase/response regulator CckA
VREIYASHRKIQEVQQVFLNLNLNLNLAILNLNLNLNLAILKMRIALFILFFLFSMVLFSQGYLVHTYSEAEGLPSANVYGITQDHQGRMWFATRAGIAVYDGVSMETYTMSDGLPSIGFFKITVDRMGRVWALGEPGRSEISVVYHDPRGKTIENKRSRWVTIDKPRAKINKRTLYTSFQLIEQNSTGKPIIVIGTTRGGLFMWNAFNRGKWLNLTTKDGLLSNAVNGIAALNGKCYVVTDQGLSIIKTGQNAGIDIDNGLNQSLGLPFKEIQGICIEHKDKFPGFPIKDSRVWLFGNQWLGYFDENNFKMTLFPARSSSDESDPMVNMLPDYRGGVYIGTRSNLSYFNYKTRAQEVIDMGNGLIGTGAHSIFIDYEKSMWFACERGVSKISSRCFGTFQRANGLLEDEVTAIIEYEPGKFVLGHNYGITFYDGNQLMKVPFSKRGELTVTSNRVLDMKVDSTKNLWLAVSFAGLAKINPARPHEITWYGEKNGLLEEVMCLCIDKNNNDKMWVGTSDGLYLPGDNRTKPGAAGMKKFKKIFHKSVRKIYGESGELLYLGTDNEGVYMYSMPNQQWKNARVPGNQRANSIFAIKKTSNGRLLIGTLTGLYILEKETLKKFSANGFQVHRPVYLILEDPKNRLWFGTDNGVIRWDGKNRRTYAADQGLIGNETNRAAGIIDSKGRIWIGTNRSVSIYDEQFDNSDAYNPPPKVRLLFLEASDRQIPLKAHEPVRLDYDNNNIAFYFRGISFLNERSIRFKHKLEGFEKEWSQEASPYNQKVQYINAPPGTYRFHLKAGNALGVWSDEVVSPKIIILGPYYKTWWFVFLMVLAAGSLFYGISRYFAKKRYAALLEKQVEERTLQLQAVEKRYQDLFQDSKDVVFFTSIEGKLVDINPAGVELLGYSSKEEMLNTNSIRAFYNNLRDLAVLRRSIEKQGYVKDYEFIITRKDGEPITILMTATLVKTPAGKIIGYRGIIRDISQQKKLEQQLIQAQKMEAIGTLAGGIAHDFNNILGAILGYTELVLDDAPRGTLMQKNAQRILDATQRAAGLVRQILAFSRQSKQEQKPLILADIVKEALKLFRSSLPATIEIRQKIKDASGVILGDPTQIHQVMMNLCANAAHAMKDTGGILVVELDEVLLDAESPSGKNNLKPGAYLRLMVNDTGHGIPQAVMKRIFEPYFTTKKTGEGTGMGLAMIHGIVKNHNGDISVYSEPGKGTSFHLFFPKIQEKTGPGSKLTQKVPGGKERILLVDDEKALAEMGTQMLERLGYEVKGISNPRDALETFRQDPDRFQLVISDLTMPHMTGIQLAQELKKIKPQIPIILCSGYGVSLPGEQIYALGIDDFIMKPVIKSELAHKVRRVLDK